MYYLSYVFFSRVSKSAGPNTCPGDFLSGTFTLSKNDLVKRRKYVHVLYYLCLIREVIDAEMREERAIHVHVYLVENVPFP